MGKYLLKGHVSYALGRKYIWTAEFGKNTCDKCAALDGKVFEEGEVPYWPHPNCRCKVEEISEIDPIESEINEYKEEIEQLKLRANELLGDTRVLREQIERALREAQSKEANSLEAKLTRLEFEIYKLIDKIEAFTRDTIDKYVIQKVQREIEILENNIDDFGKYLFDKVVNTAGSLPGLNDAKEFYNIASKPMLMGNPEGYIERNGKFYEKVTDLKNYKLEILVRDKLKSQINITEAAGVVYDSDSAPAKVISNSNEFRNYIKQNKDNLLINDHLPDKALFLQSTPNNALAYHGCDLRELSLDADGTLHAIVIDTVDYNTGEWWVAIPRHYQEEGKLENYFSVTKIEIPMDEWMNY